MSTVDCRRCGQTREALAAPPLPGALGEEVRAGVCAACWQDWERAEVMVINELRLNFMDPRAQETLEGHMREFLFLDGAADGADG